MRKKTRQTGLLQHLLWLMVLALMLGGMGNAAAAVVDLSVSAYLQTPSPVPRGGEATFSVTVTNNEDLVDATGNVRLAVELPGNVDFSSSAAPAGCTFNLLVNPKLLSCVRSGLPKLQNWNVEFKGIGLNAAAVSTRASVSFDDVDTDNNSANNVSIKTLTVIKGADLRVGLNGTTGLSGCPAACTAAAGATVGYRVDVTNAGPDSASQFKVTFDLPASTDLTYGAATGTGWACTPSGTTLTCNYSGAAIGAGGQAPPINVTGRIVKNTAGTITAGASVASTDLQTGDPDESNNGPRQVIVAVKSGTDLDAKQTLTSNASGLTSLTAGEAVSLNLWAVNSGTQDASGVTVSTTVSSDFIIGTLPTGCARVGQTITCTVGALAHGATSSKFLIPMTVAETATGGANVVNVARTGPLDGLNNPASDTYSIVAPFAHLTLAKSKSPLLVAAGGDITNTISVTNSATSTSVASGTVTVTDTLPPQEAYVGFSGTGWACSAVGQLVTCTYTIPGDLPRGAKLPNLILTTRAQAGFTGSLTNRACTGKAAGSSHQPPDNSDTGNCADATVTSTPLTADLSIVKTASLASLPATSNTFSYTLTVSNAGPDRAPTVSVVDALPHWYNGSGGTTTGSAVLAGAGTGESCVFGSTVTCTVKELAAGASRTVTITLNRPLKDGALLNTATVSSPDAIDSNMANNSSAISATVVPIADVAVTTMASAPDPVRVGVPVVYTTSIKNNGPSNAANVVLRQVLDPARMTYVAGSASIGGSAAQCSLVSSFSGAPYAGQAGIECRTFALAEGEARQLIFSAIPVFPYPDPLDAAYTSNATITTTTFDSNAANNSNSTTVTVINKELDLSVSASDTGYEQLPFGDGIMYQVTVQNNGPSLATGMKLIVTPVPPPQNGAAAPYTMLWDKTGSTLPAGASCNQPGGAGTDVICTLSGDSLLSNGANRAFGLKFDTGPVSNTPLGSLTYAIRATVESQETGGAPFAGDKLPLNNTVAETTTVLPKTDLIMVSKTVSPASPFSINQPFTYTLVAGNLGPAQAASTVVTDVLPAGLVLAGTPTAQLGSGAPLSLNNCVSSGTPVTVTCTLGVLPVASSAADTNNLVTITIPVKAPYPAYAGPFGSNIRNTASIAPTAGTSRDSTPGNNSSSVDIQIIKSSIAGSVYNDANRSNTMDAGEKITRSVTFSLYGRDFWGNDIGTAGAPVTLSTSTGDFLFDRLPRSDAAGYTLIETQPAGYADLFETAGTAGGVTPPATCDGGVNCSASPAHNTISQIVLAQNTAATGYLFQEYAYATINGHVYADLNNNGLREAGEDGIAGVQVKISGLTFWGADVCAYLGSACTVTTNASGQYGFANVPPSKVGESYTVTQLTQRAGYADGKDQNGAGAGNVIPNSAGRAAPESIVIGSIEPGQNYIERNFGELPLASIAGSVFMDSNRDAVRQAGETTGVAGVTLTLSGNDYLGNPVCPSALVASCTVQSDASGNYSFAGLPPSGASGYNVTVTTLASLIHIGAQAGSLGAIIDGVPRTSGTGVVGATLKTSAGIVLNPAAQGTGYHFGQAPGNSGGTAQSISGFVYVDVNRNGRKDADEAGIAGVAITLSGLTHDGFEVCSVIGASACTVQTGADGAYRLDGLPPSGPAGYTIKETQPVAYADGLESLGTVTGGTGASNGAISGTAPQFDQFSGIVLPTGSNGANYNFGEFGASISGNVYLDLDGNGVLSAGDTPLAGVTVTLGGAATATTTTDASGNYRFEGLAAGTYTVTETQPVNYAEGGQQAGSAGGNATQVNIISAIPVARGAELTAYNFAEKAGSLAGVVYADTNNNGQRDAGEAGIGGVVLTLTGTAQDGVTIVNRTVTTAADGSYSFGALPNANAAGYTVVETQPAAYLDGRQSKGQVDGAVCTSCDISVANTIARIAFDAGKSYTGFDFGELLPATISGSVYMDHNRDAVRQPEESTGVAGVTVTLSGNDYQGNPVCPSAAIASCTFVTDANGNYSIGKLPPSGPGGYAVSVTTPAHLVNVGTQSGSLGATIGGAVRAPGVGVTGATIKTSSGIIVTPGASGTGYHFGQAPGNSGSAAQSVSGFVYVDANRNGRKDAGEAGIAGVAITLSGLTHDGFEVCSVIGASACTVQTGADGAYRLDGLPPSGPAGYTIKETQPAAYADGLESLGMVTGGANGVISGTPPQFDQFSGIVLPSGGIAVNYNFGEFGASISGNVYLDLDGNGVLSAGDTPLAGVTVTLGGAATATTTTDASGNYRFEGLAAGTYTVTETQPVNYAEGGQQAGSAGGNATQVNIISAIPVARGAELTAYNFAEKAGSLAGVVYADTNNNGQRDAGEAGIGGVVLTLTGTAQDGVTTVNRTVTTAADGSYSFGALPNANAAGYTVVETQPAAYLDGRQSKGQVDGAVCTSCDISVANTIARIAFDAGKSYTGFDFGELLPATISGSVYMDHNRDAVRQPEESMGVAGVTVTLSGNDYQGNPVCPSAAIASCTFVTDANGNYSIGKLPPSGPGGYAVSVTTPAHLVNVGTQSGSLGATISGAVRAPGVGVTGSTVKTASGIVVLPGSSGTDYHFAQAPGNSGGTAQSVSGFVYVDVNRNGRKDAGEAGIAGVAITLSGLTHDGFEVCSVIGASACSVLTGADGAYRFDGLPQSGPLGYTIAETQPAAYADGLESLGTVTGGSGASIGVISGPAPQFDQFSGIVLPNGGSAVNYNFGELGASISGNVYLDLDGNGVLSPGDAPLAGVTVTLSGPVTVTVVTDAHGNYRFDGLPAGTYTVTETQPANYADAGQSAGSAGGNASVPNIISAIPLARGVEVQGYNFGEKSGSISGSVYVDSNDNGVRDAGETGIAGVTLTLTGTAQDGVTAVHQTITTQADGSYSFSGLLASNAAGYTIVETQPAAYIDGRHRKGLVNGVACAGCDIGASNVIARIVFDPARSYTLFDFGELQGSSIAGRVYADQNDNGVHDDGEALPGVALTLTGTDDRGNPVNVTVVTGADGSYVFTGLRPSGPGGYSVTETQPAGLGNYPAGSGSQVGSINNKPVGVADTDVIKAIVLPPQGIGTGYDFRDVASSISGFVYLDLNDNGVMDAGETGIAGVEVTLTGSSPARSAAITMVKTTGADGSFRFDGLPAGSYTLVESQPARYLDGRETAGSAGGKVDNSSFGNAPEQNSIADIVLPAATRATGYLFGERNALGKVGGSVYLDLNNDGVRNDGEKGIAGVVLTLSGNTSDGKPLKLSVTSAADGSYLFDSVPPGDAAGYTLTQTQPAGYRDGKTTVLPGSVGTAATVKPVGVGNLDVITGIKVAAGDDMRGYLFGEIGVPQLKPPIVNGYVWLNHDGSRVRPLDGSHAGVAGWTAELHQNGKLICRANTDEKGFYQFDNLHCPGYEDSGLPIGSGYSITFLKDGNNMPIVPVSTGGEGVVVPGGSRIANITLNDGDAVVEQNLPLDPAGVVYDSVTRKPVPGAVVSISGPAGFDSATHLVGGTAEQTQTVGTDGMYQFLLQNGFPSGVYTLSVVAPPNYMLAPSTSLPACHGPLNVGLLPNPAFIQASEFAPALSVRMEADPNSCTGLIAGGARTTQYYMSFVITNGGSAPILNNHIPLDPLGSDSIMVTKTTPMVNVTRGDLVPYTITASNPKSAALGATQVRDLIPAGFKYRTGSASRDGVPAEPVVDGRNLVWRENGFASNEKKTYKLMLMVGTGVGDGEYTNQAWAANGGSRISNLASATVRVVPDATFDCPDIIGKVFDDRNANGYQDEGEPGIPGVRMATARGLLVTTDAEGRFHVPCPAIPNADRGSNFVMKLDDRTLPSGYRVTTENPRDVRLTRGKVVKLNFGATVHRVVRIELTDAAFVAGGTALQAEWVSRIDGLITTLRGKPSILRIAYLDGADAALVERRSKALASDVQARWQALQDEYPLVIEIEGTK
ncbi:SdrD B-like domain-containing protein [Janthinobacterium sp. Mn2066]|uniref:SdrD B-like domain-containing protein n=1 Tax=Janthinobacterium sp. Mn2066 TaxID=3395264 RepID=UPI003BE26E96